MYSIGEVSKITSISARAIRHYESKDLIKATHKGNNGYRYFSDDQVERLKEIKFYRNMEFSIEDIKELLSLKETKFFEEIQLKLKGKLFKLDSEVKKIEEIKLEINNQLLATEKLLNGQAIGRQHRRILMDVIKSEVLKNLKIKKTVTAKDLSYLKREEYLYDTEEKREFILAVQRCIEFVKNEGIKLGPARGSSPALLSLYALGWGDFDPIEYDLVPERFIATEFDLHIDVEFKNGKRFVDFCKGVSAQLKIGKIEAFRLPILDIIENVQNRLEKRINFDEISNDDDIVLDQFRKGDIKNIFSFDIPKDTLIAKHYDENYYKNGLATKMLSNYLKSQKVLNFQDLLNIEAIHRPDLLDNVPFMRTYIDRYPKAKLSPYTYSCFSETINEYLKKNFGLMIYQEDLLFVINEYTGWSFEKCNIFRKMLAKNNVTKEMKEEFLSFASQDVLNTIKEEARVLFCKAHSVGAWPKLIKATAILKHLHKELYLEELKNWQEENGYSWGDFGIIQNGVSLLQ